MPMKTHAAVLHRLGHPLRIQTLDVPPLRPGQVLVDVAYAGLCHTQLLEVRGRRGRDPHLPHTLGHEGSGVVRAVGDGVRKVRPGDRVVLTWIRGDGADVPTTKYASDEGPVGSGAISTFLESAVVSENRVVAISDDMPLREAALLGCAVPTGAGIVREHCATGGSIAVFGLGGIGLSAILCARAMGASTIIGIDVVPSKLETVQSLGATHTLDARREDVVQAVRDLTDGGVDLCVEASGSPQAMSQAHRSTRRGGVCVVAGNPSHGTTFAVDPFDLIQGRGLTGSWGGAARPDEDIPLYVRWFLEGRLPVDRLVSREYPLEGINDALEDLEAGRLSRGILSMSAPDQDGSHPPGL